jgi:hypothetical protein
VGHFSFGVRHGAKLKGFVWVWMERVSPKQPKIANDGVIAVRVTNLAQRDLLLAAEPEKFFTEPHYAGFPAVLVRLSAVTVADLRMLFADAWRTQATKARLAGTSTNDAEQKRVRRSESGALRKRRAT